MRGGGTYHTAPGLPPLGSVVLANRCDILPGLDDVSLLVIGSMSRILARNILHVWVRSLKYSIPTALIRTFPFAPLLLPTSPDCLAAFAAL